MANGVGQSVPLPGEAPLLVLAGRFVVAEQTIRELVRLAPEGDRRTLLQRALTLLHELRREVARLAVAGTLYAFEVAALAVELITGRPAPAPERAEGLGRSLALGLDRALVNVEQRSREVFPTVRTDTLAEAERTALTAYTDRAGARRQLADVATMRTKTTAAHAGTRATLDVLGDGARVTISSQAAPDCNFNNICTAFRGRTLTVGDRRARFAPFHPSCSHRTLPAGQSLADVAGAQAEAVRAMGEAVVVS